MEHNDLPEQGKHARRVGDALLLTIPIVFAATVVFVWWAIVTFPETVYRDLLPVIVAFVLALTFLILYLVVYSSLRGYRRATKIITIQLEEKAGELRRSVGVISGSGEGFWEIDLVANTVYFNEHLMQMLGYLNQGKTMPLAFWRDAIHPDDVPGVERTLAAHLDKRTPTYNIEYRIKRANGEYLWVEDKGRAVLEDGQPIRVAGVMEDVSNIKRVQEVLQSRTKELEDARVIIEAEIQNVKKFQKAVEASVDAVAILSPDKRIVYTNPAWIRLNGFTDTESIGQSIDIIASGDMNPETVHALWETVSAGNTFKTEDMFYRTKRGEAYQAELAVFPIREGEQVLFYVFVAQDITKRKEVDKAKTEFVSLASHQLRTPLSAIRWYSEMLMSKYVGELNEKQKEYVLEIYQGSLRMVDLVNSLLNVSRIDLGTFAIEPEQVSLTEICDSVIAELTPQVSEKSQTVDRIYAQAPQTYFADPKLMRVIFQNLLSNSVKYTKNGGLLSVEIASRGAKLYIRVADNGYGIPKEQQSHIFEKLFRADNVRQLDTEGTGLGMYIIKAIVDVSGGSIWFESEENRGTTFHILLPGTGMPRKSGAKDLS